MNEFHQLRFVCPRVYVVAHNEDTALLTMCLLGQGFQVDVIRGPYAPDQLLWSADMRCLVNHANVWRKIAASDMNCIVVEADFVPVVGFGGLHAPMPRVGLSSSLVYLYAVAPQFWDLDSNRLARGHAGGMVATIISPEVARLMLVFFREVCLENPTGVYFGFDSKIGYWLKGRGVQSYIPYSHYGEHGGVGNPEHVKAGLGRSHRADALFGPLQFIPEYAARSCLKYRIYRVWARIWGLCRLLAGRMVAPSDIFRSKFRLLLFAVKRVFSA